MEKYEHINWIVNQFQEAISTGISIIAEELIDSSLKLKFGHNNLIQFWLPFQQTFPIL